MTCVEVTFRVVSVILRETKVNVLFRNQFVHLVITLLSTYFLLGFAVGAGDTEKKRHSPALEELTV